MISVPQVARESSIGSAVVITGLGVVSPLGAGVDTFWRGLARGQQAIEPLELFDASGHRTHLAATVPARALALPLDLFSRRAGCGLSRTDRMTLLAAQEAWRGAGLPEPGSSADARGIGLFFGSMTAGMYEAEQAFWGWPARGHGRVRTKAFARQPNGTPAETLARHLSLEGPIEVMASACSASSMAIESALDALRSGEVEIALAGGADGLCQTAFGGFNALRAVDPRPTRPFRPDRAGLSLGEGAALLVLETRERALERGAAILGGLAGSGSSCDAYHMTAPAPDGEGVARAMRKALEDARIDADSIAFFNAHGSGTPQNDAAEAQALGAVFGARATTLPVTSTKGCIGHSLGSCGALEAVATLLCLRHGAVHPTPGTGPVDTRAAVDLVLGEPRPLVDARFGMTVNLAFGGANVALIVEHGFTEAQRA